jgi:hypothetical protein
MYFDLTPVLKKERDRERETFPFSQIRDEFNSLLSPSGKEKKEDADKLLADLCLFLLPRFPSLSLSPFLPGEKGFLPFQNALLSSYGHFLIFASSEEKDIPEILLSLRLLLTAGKEVGWFQFEMMELA